MVALSLFLHVMVFLQLTMHILSMSISSRSSTSTSFINHMESLIHKYDYFIIDQWGVLHNGKVPYPGVIECLQNLKNAGKCLILLSNSSKRKSSSIKGLAKVGIDPSLFFDIVTSGELGFQQLSYVSSKWGKKFFVFGNGDDDASYIESAGCEISMSDHATAALARGTFSIWNGKDNEIQYKTAAELMANVDPWLAKLAARNIPLLVTNPDFSRPGNNDPMPGLIGAKYEKLGQKVEYIGKPYNDVYSECLVVINRHIMETHKKEYSKIENDSDLKSRICCVGDSLDHDILGAKRTGLDSLWTINGVHCADLDLVSSEWEGRCEVASEAKALEVIAKFGQVPTWAIPSFYW